MRLIFLLLSTLLFQLTVLGQAVSPPSQSAQDYIVRLDGQKVQGQILMDFKKVTFDQIEFLTQGGEVEVFLPGELLEFGFESGRVFRTYEIPAKGNFVFGQLLFSSSLSLVKFVGDFYIDNGSDLFELKKSNRTVVYQGQKVSKQIREYVATLKTLMEGECGTQLAASIEKSDLVESKLIDLLEMYHKCQGQSYDVFVDRSPFLKLGFALGVGVSAENFIGEKVSQSRQDQISISAYPHFFGGLTLHSFRNTPRFQLELRAYYSSFSGEINSSFEGSNGSLEIGEQPFNGTRIHFPIYLNYLFLKKGRTVFSGGPMVSVVSQEITYENGRINNWNSSRTEVVTFDRNHVQGLSSTVTYGAKLSSITPIGSDLQLLIEAQVMPISDIFNVELPNNSRSHSSLIFSISTGIRFR
ncbi:hypothetical protein [Algoriphagus formosus]|uniref:hypothetical protein n=1 Tax=Algoriphagus formosus TaxID=2007308 RepID=UPI000C28A000|nr:hypothetical protein [Algoriphagus formosus]